MIEFFKYHDVNTNMIDFCIQSFSNTQKKTIIFFKTEQKSFFSKIIFDENFAVPSKNSDFL